MNRIAHVSVFALCAYLAVCQSTDADTTFPVETRKIGRHESVVYRLPGMDQVERARVRYDERRSMDVYYPAGYDFVEKLPVVVFAMGYSDEDFLLWTRMRLKDLGMYVAWSQLVAASGMIAVTYETDHPDTDLFTVLDFLRREGGRFGIDGERIGLWSCSGNASIAVDALTTQGEGTAALRCAVAYYPIVAELLLPEADLAHVSAEVRRDVPILIAKAGRDKPALLNQAIDRFTDAAKEIGIPVVVLTHESGVHGFDIHTVDERSREIIVLTLEFMKRHLAD